MSSVKPPFKHQWIGLAAEQWSLAISFLSKVAFQGLQGRILIHIDLWAWEFEQAWELQEKSPQSNNFFMISNYIKLPSEPRGFTGHPDQVCLKQEPTSMCLSRNFSCISHLWQKSAWHVFPFSHNTVMELFSSQFNSQDLSILLLPDFQSESEMRTASQNFATSRG